jgi:hypothetical protein
MFDWQTDEDGKWQEEVTAVPPHPATRFGRKAKGLLAGLGVLVLLLAGFWVAFRRADSQVTAVTNTIEQEVLAADQLLLETAVAGDEELFTSLMLGRKPDWYDVQTRLLNRYLLLDRAPLGFWLNNKDDLFPGELVTATQVTLSPDLTLAEVRRPLPYVTITADGEWQELVLQRTAIYQRQDNGWRLAEPDDEFWGEYEHVARPYLDVITPARDAEIAAQLADDLSDLIRKVCTKPTMNCSPRLVLQLRLDKEPQSLFSLYDHVRLNTAYLAGERTTRVSLPAPTLLGLPLDETGYEVLYRGYATQLTLALLTTFSTAEEMIDGFVPQPPNFAPEMADLGLFMPWPPDYSPVRQAEPPPIPLPERDILLLCQDSRAPSLFRYDMDETTWYDAALETEGAVSYNMVAMPDGRGALLTVYSVTDNLMRLVWVNGGRERLLLAETSFPAILEVSELEPGRYLIYYNTSLSPDGGQNFYGEYRAAVLDEAACDDDSCELQPFERALTPSPDGRFNLITRLDEEAGLVYEVEDAEGGRIRELGPIRNPQWLDEQTVAYLESVPAADFVDGKLVILTLTPEGKIDQQHEVTSQDLIETVPGLAYAVGGSFFLNEAVPDYHDPDRFLLSAYEPQMIFPHLFTYDWRQDELSPWQWPLLPPADVNMFAGESATGRYLTFVDDRVGFALLLFDQQEETWQQYSLRSPRFLWRPFTWSEDDAWLLLLDEEAVRLIAPAHGYEKMLFHGLGYCETAVWVGEG